MILVSTKYDIYHEYGIREEYTDPSVKAGYYKMGFGAQDPWRSVKQIYKNSDQHAEYFLQ
jgi:hypothetical protein